MTAVDRPAGTDRRSARRQATRDEIVAAAWDLVREHGLAGLALRDLAQRVGMKAPSLYSYFGSKAEIYDAMFLEGYLRFEEVMDAFEAEFDGAGPDLAPRPFARATAHAFFSFCVADPVRYQLLFQRTIPDFVPSEESYAVALASYERMAERFARLGVTEPAALDLWTAMMTGLTSQQLANDPGGDRWERLVDRAVDMLLGEIAPDFPTDPDPETDDETKGQRR